MATITEPMALDKTFNTTETTPRSQADVLAAIENAIIQGFGRSASDVSYDNTTSGLSADDVQEAVDELAAEKVDKVEGKGLSSNDFTDEDKAALDNMELDIESTQTASGNPITLTDCAPINAESLKVELEPKQDLHGYQYPWVGGAGKNKLPMTVDGLKAANTEGTWSGNAYTRNGVTYTILTDDGGNVTGININGTNNQSSYASFWICDYAEIPGQCIVNGWAVSGDPNSAYVQINKKPIGGGAASIEGYLYTDQDTLNLSDTSYLYTYIIYVPSGKTVNNLLALPMFRLSTETDPTFAPYSNICPITGYTECEVDDVGVNQWDEEWELGDLDSQGNPTPSSTLIRSKNFISVVSSTTYYFKSNVIGYFAQYDANKIIIGIKFNVYAGTTFTTASNARYIKFILDGAYGVTYNHDISINYPSSDHDYHAYASTSATIQFGQTVYGGRSNFTDGGTDDEVAEVDFSTALLTKNDPENANDYLYYIQGLSTNKNGYLNCSCAPKKTSPPTGNNLGVAYSGSGNIYINLTSAAISTNTVEGMRTYCVNNGVQLVYEKATPTIIATPPSPLKLLKGTNHITTNGTTINLGYQPDNVIGEVKGEIEKCAVDAEFAQFTDGNDTFTDVNLTLDGYSHTLPMVGSKIEQKRFICFEVTEIRSGAVQGIHASCIAFADGAKTPSGTAFRAYIESLQMYVNFRIYGSGGSYTLAYQSETSFSASAFYVRVRMMNNL